MFLDWIYEAVIIIFLYSSSEPLKNNFPMMSYFSASFQFRFSKLKYYLVFFLSLGQRWFIPGYMLLFFKLSSVVASGYTNCAANKDWTHEKRSINPVSCLLHQVDVLLPDCCVFFYFVRSIKLFQWPVSSLPCLFGHLITYTIQSF